MSAQLRALVIDDEAPWRRQLQALLEDVGYTVKSAESREQADELLQNSIYDLVVVDVNLTDAPFDESGEPEDQQGMEIIADLRRYAKKRDLAIIIVTGFGTGKITRQAFKSLGVNDIFFKKGFDIKAFRAAALESVADAKLRDAGFEVDEL
jgi:CheY-like chemotaxis protein